MLSFALNYYFGGGFESTFAFKLTNITIHLVSAALLYILCMQLLQRALLQKNTQHSSKELSRLHITAGSIALIWALHPINLTSVLYIVQRMTSLSGLFSLASITCYLATRDYRLRPQAKNRSLFGYLLASLLATLAVLSKENAILLPLFILLIELTLYTSSPPWARFSTITGSQQKLVFSLIALLAISFFLYTLNYASHGYSGRTFTMTERIMTEARVICFYLSLIILPRINAFGLFHDDIPISTTLFSPISTIPSIIIILVLIACAVSLRKNRPLFSLGIGWFFIGHLLESTVFGLEITHEHRNYLPSAGIIFAGFSLIYRAPLFSEKKMMIIATSLVLIAGSTTWLRSFEWGNYLRLAEFEAQHHPNSAATQTLLSNALYKNGEYIRSRDAILKASNLDPQEASYLMNLQLLSVLQNVDIPKNTQQKILNILATQHPTASTQIAIDNIVKCTGLGCKEMLPNIEEWLRTILSSIKGTKASSNYHYLLGRILKSKGQQINALNAFQKAHENDKQFLHPLFEMIDILTRLKQLENAETVFSWLEIANTNNPHPQDKEVARLKKSLELLWVKSGTDHD